VKNIIQGLFKTHIKVRNLEKSIQFYQQVLGLKLGHFESERRVAFFWIGAPGQAMLGVWETPEENFPKQHFAFNVALEQMRTIREWFSEHGLEYCNFSNSNTGSLEVLAWMPAISIYFSDPDMHSLEFIAMLPDAPRPDLGVIAWEGWETLHGR
jgi:lactoylglutathione lyase